MYVEPFLEVILKYSGPVRMAHRLLSTRRLTAALKSLQIFKNIFIALAAVYKRTKRIERYMKPAKEK